MVLEGWLQLYLNWCYFFSRISQLKFEILDTRNYRPITVKVYEPHIIVTLAKTEGVIPRILINDLKGWPIPEFHR